MAAFGRTLGAVLRADDAIALFGDLGAGKTTLVRGIMEGLGWTGEVASPSFPIIITYDPPDVRIPVWHVDLYRIEEAHELDELGLFEARGAAALLIEWPERLGAGLWSDALHLTIERAGDDARILTAQCPTAWEDRWPAT